MSHNNMAVDISTDFDICLNRLVLFW